MLRSLKAVSVVCDVVEIYPWVKIFGNISAPPIA